MHILWGVLAWSLLGTARSLSFPDFAPATEDPADLAPATEDPADLAPATEDPAGLAPATEDPADLAPATEDPAEVAAAAEDPTEKDPAPLAVATEDPAEVAAAAEDPQELPAQLPDEEKREGPARWMPSKEELPAQLPDEEKREEEKREGPARWMPSKEEILAKIGPAPVWDALQSMVIFIGTGRSGSSLVGALLDAHPKVIVPNEYNLMENLEDNRESMFTKLYYLSLVQADSRRGGGSYEYKVPNQWQGRVKHMMPAIIGDKKASHTAELGFDKLSEQVRALVNVTRLPLKIIHVTRNPFDNIATLTLVKYFHKKYGKMNPNIDNITHEFEEAVDAGTKDPLDFDTLRRLYKHEEEEGEAGAPTPAADLEDEAADAEGRVPFLTHWISHYFERMETVRKIDEVSKSNPLSFGSYPVEVIHLDYNLLVAEPKRRLFELMHKLGVGTPGNYTEDAASIVWPSNHYTRLYVKWGQKRICRVLERAQGFPFLQHYMLEGTPGNRKSNPPCRDQCFPGLWPCPCSPDTEQPLESTAQRVDSCTTPGQLDPRLGPDWNVDALVYSPDIFSSGT